MECMAQLLACCGLLPMPFPLQLHSGPPPDKAGRWGCREKVGELDWRRCPLRVVTGSSPADHRGPLDHAPWDPDSCQCALRGLQWLRPSALLRAAAKAGRGSTSGAQRRLPLPALPATHVQLPDEGSDLRGHRVDGLHLHAAHARGRVQAGARGAVASSGRGHWVGCGEGAVGTDFNLLVYVLLLVVLLALVLLLL